ncbi:MULTISPECIES: HAD-IIIC family phosphatase [unclassified Acinetobacter]|uniref:HAD-IIIC family phosphatase n=1 Tax=unclassified Acinetobacter TaxID=196816 RepID=UPI0018ED490E|nr:MULTISPECIES: HAD-IIIC family phosphatase [unclassified Acinetobacter]MBJ6352988.1 HAD-IIIC family phosphatase [Acinetobacter sp. c1]MBM0958607.1 HAD-IIIC family phosphatase [Acinetobacter sp. C13]
MSNSSLSSLHLISKLYNNDFPASNLNQLKYLLSKLNTTDDRAQAGILCRKLDQKIYIDHTSSRSFNLAIVSNFTYHSIANLLRCRLLAEGVYPNFYLSDYNQYYYELLNNESLLYQSNPNLTLCIFDEHIIFDELNENWNIEQLDSIIQNKLSQLAIFAEYYNRHNSGLLVFTTIPLSLNNLKQCIDYKSRAKICKIWHQFNADINALSEQYNHVFTIETSHLLNSGIELHDPRLAFYTKAYMSTDLLDQISNELVGIIRAQCGLAKKCLVLDLDNTIWGGILGDDGIDGIQLSGHPVGEAYLYFQKVVNYLSKQGVLLAISSKNELANVKEVFRSRKDMNLSLDDFSVIFANWDPKSLAIKNISETLNLGIDSFVFVDDSNFEREEVKQKFPNIVVINPGYDPSEYVSSLLNNNNFCQLELSQEDFKRSELYKVEAKRKNVERESNNIDDFLNQLKIELKLFVPMQQDISRVSQLTLRTNQFNMTTKRLSESDVESYLSERENNIISLQSHDRFGDYGQIGCIFYRIEGKTLWINNFILSCRVFSRQIEDAALSHLLTWAKAQHFKEVRAKFIPTLKNQKASDIYAFHGFDCISDNDEGKEYIHILKSILPLPKHIQINATYGN